MLFQLSYLYLPKSNKFTLQRYANSLKQSDTVHVFILPFITIVLKVVFFGCTFGYKLKRKVMEKSEEKELWDLCESISEKHNGIIKDVHVESDYFEYDTQQEYKIFTSCGALVIVQREESYKDEFEETPTGGEEGWFYSCCQPYTNDGFNEIEIEDLISDIKASLNN